MLGRNKIENKHFRTNDIEIPTEKEHSCHYMGNMVGALKETGTACPW